MKYGFIVLYRTGPGHDVQQTECEAPFNEVLDAPGADEACRACVSIQPAGCTIAQNEDGEDSAEGYELSATLESRAESRPFVLVTMAAGLSMQQIRMMAGSGYPIIRMMPNTPVALGDGMIQYCSDDVEPEKMAEWLAAMAPAGRLDAVPEGMMDAASAVSGCGPAWAYQFIEALADGGVAAGLPRAKAQEYAAQMLLGSARMVLETGKHPGELKDAVCSPGGSTIQGVRLLEERAFRGAVTDAVLAAYEKTKDLGKK